MKQPGMVRVLIVDDLTFMRKLLGEIAEAEGFVISGEARNGHEAFARYRESKPDIVLMDITMPGQDGVSALKDIMGHDPQAKVIMCSAISEQSRIREAIILGASDYIVKPFRPPRVIRALRRAAGLEAV